MVAAGLLVALALAAAIALRVRPLASGPSRPLAVLVQEPRIAASPPDERSPFAAFALREAIVRTLAGLEGIEAIGPDELPAGALSVQDAARAVAADEVVLATIACEGQWCRVSLRRQRGRDARVLMDTGSFDVSSDPVDSLALSDAVALHVREAFSDHRPRSPAARLEVKSADYQRYLVLRRRMETGEVLGRAEIDPWVAGPAVHWPDGGFRPATSARGARGRKRFRTHPAAEIPQSGWRARLAPARKKALSTNCLLDRQRWRCRRRQHLASSCKSPRQSARAGEDVAQWRMGDPAKAARIYEGLLKEKVTRQNLSNLGWSLLLASDYPGAATAYRRALELEPDHVPSRMDLGIAGEGAGDPDGARSLYRDVLARLGQRERKGALTGPERLIKAQALARLGEPVPAVALTIEVLGEGDRDPRVLFQAALIYALCGEQNHAIVQAREARRRGLSAKWFGIPGFESLRDTAAFQELVAPP
jgi:hypothetical protein